MHSTNAENKVSANAQIQTLQMAASLLLYTKREWTNSSAVGKEDWCSALTPEANLFPPICCLKCQVLEMPLFPK